MTELVERPALGVLLRQWRERRRFSQLDLASDAGVSARHISFVETGRARASREMVLRLAERLEVPLRERNLLLLAAGFAPTHPARDLDDPEMVPVREALGLILDAYDPHPALAVDREWNLVVANAGVGLLTADVAAELLVPPVNVLRLSLHPHGLAPKILNLAQWRGHLLHRLAREVSITADPDLVALRQEISAYPGGEKTVDHTALAVPLRLGLGGFELALLSTVTTFGTAVDITLAELSVEAFLPADRETSTALRELASRSGPGTAHETDRAR